uniref:Uncharacterized protein n=1 Tax=Cacopsylla melanoneura TaxID=428564 RepID=A0A8D8RML9_9HEMI
MGARPVLCSEQIKKIIFALEASFLTIINFLSRRYLHYYIRNTYIRDLYCEHVIIGCRLDSGIVTDISYYPLGQKIPRLEGYEPTTCVRSRAHYFIQCASDYTTTIHGRSKENSAL